MYSVYVWLLGGRAVLITTDGCIATDNPHADRNRKLGWVSRTRGFVLEDTALVNDEATTRFICRISFVGKMI